MRNKTPSIKRFKHSLSELEHHVSGHFNNRYSLNRSEPKYKPYAWSDGSNSRTRGVESDVIVIFEDRRRSVGERKISDYVSQSIYDSFAFSFNRILEGSDKLTVTFSTKLNGTITSSTTFSEELFRSLIRELNRKFRNEGVPKDRQTLLWRLQAFFMNNPDKGIEPFDQDKALLQVLGKDGEEVIRLKDRVRAARTREEKVHNEISQLHQAINQEALTSEETLKIQRLEKEIKDLRKKLSAQKKDAFKSRGGAKLVDEEKKAISDRAEAESKLTKASYRIKQRMPADTASKQAVFKWLQENA